jgi:transglutaminase-like putative cysteine protease
MTARLTIEHTTRYDYDHDVILAQHLAYLRLKCSSWQKIRQHRLVITPEPANLDEQEDAFGNHRSYFSITKPHRCLEVHSHSLVEKLTRYGAFDPAMTRPWEEVRDAMLYSLDQPFVPASEFVWPSPYVPWHASLRDYALTAFWPGRPIGQASMALCEQIYHDFTYESGATQIHTPIESAFQDRKGVCQDFAHIMIGCLRTLGLAARYVSGYLMTTPPDGQPR